MFRFPSGSRTGTSILAAALCCVLAAGQASANNSQDGIWADVAESRVPRSSGERQIVPQSYRTLRMDALALEATLDAAPRESQTPAEHSPVRLSLPLADGRYATFRIAQTDVMAPELAARYPMIRTWVGQGIDDPGATLRLDLTPKGLRAQILSWEGTQYVDPYQLGDNSHYIAYRKRDLQARGERPRCLVTGAELPLESADFSKRGRAKVVSGATLRTHRLAMATTGEYTAFHGGTVIDGLAAIVTTVNRLNGIYERDLAVRMQLIPNNDLLVFTDPVTDPYTNNNGSTMLGQNQTTLTNLIGGANYDIGHVMSTGGGGVASLGSVCSANSKARGVTGLSAPVGDAFDVDFVAHEIGHQYRGNHTFNGSGGNCSGGNRNASTAYEPGSGISIQAYAGICSGDNLQRNSEDHFHRVSLDEMLAFTTTGGGSTCGTTNATGNTPPVVTGPGNFTIPQLTPFELVGSAVDADGDTITYLWEQFDLGAANSAGVNQDNGTRPLFRSSAPGLSPAQFYPSLRYILNNANSPPATAPIPGTTTPNFFTGEILPSTNRTLTFRLTARDNRVSGGGTNEATSVLTVVNTAGPFAVTAPNTTTTWAAGSAQTVTWNVSNTNAAPINTANVRISLSLDRGLSYPVELAASVPNNGSANITVPANTPASTQARVRVSAIGNVYFDLSDADITITGANTAPTLNVTGSVTTRQGSPSVVGVVANVNDTQQAAGSLSVSVSGAPTELQVSVANDAGSISLTATAACTLVTPSSTNKVYPVNLTVTDSDGASTTLPVNINVGSNQVPTLGNYSTVQVQPGNSVDATPSAPAADANNNLIASSVSPTSLPNGGTVSIDSAGVVSISPSPTTPLGDYTIRAAANDSCGATEQRLFTVSVTDTLFSNGFEN